MDYAKITMMSKKKILIITVSVVLIMIFLGLTTMPYHHYFWYQLSPASYPDAYYVVSLYTIQEMSSISDSSNIDKLLKIELIDEFFQRPESAESDGMKYHHYRTEYLTIEQGTQFMDDVQQDNFNCDHRYSYYLHNNCIYEFVYDEKLYSLKTSLHLFPHIIGDEWSYPPRISVSPDV